MSSYQPPYPPPGQPAAGPARKRRFSAWWFLLPLALVIGAGVLFTVLFVSLIQGVLDSDARFAADGQPHQITVPTDKDRMLLANRDGVSSCTIVDRETGEEIALKNVTGDYEKNDFEGVWVFDPGSGDLEATCSALQAGTSVEVTESFQVDRLLWVFLGPSILGGVGVVLFIIQIIIFATRAPRHPPTHPPTQAGPPVYGPPR